MTDDKPRAALVPCAVCEGKGQLPADVHAARLAALAASATDEYGDPVPPDPHSEDWYDGYAEGQRDAERAASATDEPTCRCFEDADEDHPALSTDVTPLGQHMPWCPLAASATDEPVFRFDEANALRPAAPVAATGPMDWERATQPLREELWPWLHHKMDCASTEGYGEKDGVRLTPKKPCDCGLDAALLNASALAKTPDPVTGLDHEAGCLDFSEFHPLDHWPWEQRCRDHFGGWRRHLELWHDYQAPDPVGWLFCKLGRHTPTPYWFGVGIDIDFDKDPPTGYECSRCHKEMEALQEDN